MKISVIGSGSWGTALAILLARNGLNVWLWGHKKEHVNTLVEKRENSKYLPGISFPDTLNPTSEVESAIQGSDLVVMAVPSHASREIFSLVCPQLKSGSRIISAIKGIENETLITPTQIFEEVLKNSSNKTGHIECGVLSGPSFAREVALCQPTAVTIGFRDIKTAIEIQRLFVNEYFRVYASNDVIGLEISAALKNVIAIAVGVCEGIGFGLNARAALITRGLAEMRRLGTSFNAEDSTFSGLSGLGDLVLTCTGSLSRNRQVGISLGKGKKLKEIVEDMCMVAEGIKTTAAVHDLAQKLNVEMPIMEQVYNILYRNKSCSLAVQDLLNRELKVE